jgi:hypothetical protein
MSKKFCTVHKIFGRSKRAVVSFNRASITLEYTVGTQSFRLADGSRIGPRREYLPADELVRIRKWVEKKLGSEPCT